MQQILISTKRIHAKKNTLYCIAHLGCCAHRLYLKNTALGNKHDVVSWKPFETDTTWTKYSFSLRVIQAIPS